MTTSISGTVGHRVDLDGLFRRYHHELHRFAYGKLRDREIASDVVQDAFLRYLTHERTGDSVAATTPRFFLWRIASNLVIDVARQNRRRGLHTSLENVAKDLIDPTPLAERCLGARQEFAIIKSALDELSPKARAALLLNRVEGMTHAEIGTRMGISSSMVSKYIMRALRHCGDRLDRATF